MDKIIIKNAHFLCKIGVPLEEREVPQKIIVSAEIETNTSTVGLSDDIGLGINYASIHKVMKKVCEQTFKTIEALAENIAKEIILQFKVTVTIEVQKPGALKRKDVEYAAIRITRDSLEKVKYDTKRDF